MNWIIVTDIIRIFWIGCFCVTAYFALRTWVKFGIKKSEGDGATVFFLIRMDLLRSIMVSVGGLGVFFLIASHNARTVLFFLFYLLMASGFALDVVRQFTQYNLVKKLKEKSNE